MKRLAHFALLTAFALAPWVAAAQETAPAVTPNPPVHKTRVQEQMEKARERRLAEEARRKSKGAEIRDRLHGEHQARLEAEAKPFETARENPARVQGEADQVRTQVQTQHAGGFHASDPALDWKGIATTSGQLNAVDIAEQDPCISFDGRAGALYPMTQYFGDRRADNSPARVRATFFSKPYFFRNGVRYERMTVFLGTQRCYQFVRR